MAKRYGVAILIVVAAVLAAEYLPPVVHQTPSARGPITPPAAPGSPGVTRGGTECAPGVRQVSWSHYAPICVPAWHGENGGATAFGITGSTITVTYREPSPSEQRALYSIIPSSVLGSNRATVATMQAMVKTFNHDFELYGRHVVLRPYSGEGDLVSELSGSGQAGATRDAARAKDLGAFADVSVIGSTPVYEEALAKRHVVGVSNFDRLDADLIGSSPYSYTVGNSCSKTVAETVQLVGRVLATTPVSFAGDVSMSGKKRSFGVVDQSTAPSEACSAQVVSTLRERYGVTVRPVVDLSLTGNHVAGEARVAASRLESAGVTTVLCTACDPFTPIFVTKAASNLGYHPEWVETDFLDALTALQSPAELSSVIGFGMQAPGRAGTEAYKAFTLGARTGQQVSPIYAEAYEPLLLLFGALQEAGPDLTARSFQRGFRRLPASRTGGMYGNWSVGRASFDPRASFGLVAWSASTPGTVNGTGAWTACNGGQLYSFSGRPQLPLGQPIACPI